MDARVEQLSAQEIWKPVIGFELAYEVSSCGRVRSIDRFVKAFSGTAFLRGAMLKNHTDKDGYQYVLLSAHGISTYASMHRLVAKHFLSSSDLPEINHKDLDKTNNTVANLEWVSRQQNMSHAASRGRLAARTNPHCARKLTPASANAIVFARSGGATYRTIALQFGICKSVARRVALGKSWAVVELDAR